MSNSLYNPFRIKTNPMQMGVVFKGGGGGAPPPTTTTTTGGVDPDFKRHILKGADAASGLFDSGNLSKVAGPAQDQTTAQNLIRDQANNAGAPLAGASTFGDAASGEGVFSTDQYAKTGAQLAPQIGSAIQGALGQQAGQFSRSGNLGGARAEAAAASAAGQIATDLTQQEVGAQRQQALSGAQGQLGAQGQQFGQQAGANQALVASGQDQQQQSQNQLDASYQGVQRLFGLINPGTVGSSQTSTQTGGSSGGGGK